MHQIYSNQLFNAHVEAVVWYYVLYCDIQYVLTSCATPTEFDFVMVNLLDLAVYIAEW